MFKRMKLANKISLVAGIVVLLGIGLICFLVLRSVYSSSTAQAKTLAGEISESGADDITDDFEMVKNTEQGLCNAIVLGRNTGSLDREKVIELLRSTLEGSPSTILALYTLWEPNEFDGKDGDYVNKEGYDSTGRFIPYIVRSGGEIIHEPLLDYETEGAGDYYLIPRKTGEPALIEPYLYKIDGKEVLITSLVIPVKDASGKFQGIIGADIALSWIQEKAEAVKPMGGFTSIISSGGTYAGHGLKPGLVSKNISEIEKHPEEILKTISGGEYLDEYAESAVTGEQSLQIYVPIAITGVGEKWSFMACIPVENIYAEYYKLLEGIIFAFIAIFAVMIAVIYFSVRKEMSPLRFACESLRSMADADFTRSPSEKYSGLKSEIGDLIRDMSKMQSDIRSVIKTVVHEADNVGTVVSEASAFMNDMNSNVDEVSAATEQLSAGMEETAASSQEMNSMSEEIEKSVETMAGRAQNGALTAKEISKRAAELMEAAAASRNSTIKIKASVEAEMRNSIENSKAVLQINTLSNTILSIAAQTNLLALNATIEAARAGEAGRGFAVVAEEIRNLADDSKKTAGEIQTIIKTVLIAVEDLSQNSLKALDFIDRDVVRDYDFFIKSSEQYSSDADYIDRLVADFSAVSEEISRAVQSIAKMISEISAAANEGAEGTSDITRQISVIVDKSNKVTLQAKSARESSGRLLETVSRFKV